MNGYKDNCLILKGFSGGQGRNRTTDTRIFSPRLKRSEVIVHTAILSANPWNIYKSYPRISR